MFCSHDRLFRALPVGLAAALCGASTLLASELIRSVSDGSDRSDRFDPMFDFLSIHYQGTNPFTNWCAWRERKDAEGNPNPVLFWDTESWVANSEDRVAGVLATMYSFGQNRAVGIDSQRSMAIDFRRIVPQSNGRPVRGADGKAQELQGVHVSGVAAAVGAFQHLVGEDRAVKKLLTTTRAAPGSPPGGQPSTMAARWAPGPCMLAREPR